MRFGLDRLSIEAASSTEKVEKEKNECNIECIDAIINPHACIDSTKLCHQFSTGGHYD